MPLAPLPGTSERELLLGWLSHGRYMLTVTAHGLSDEQAHATPTVSTLSIAGVIAHSAAVERAWMNGFLQRETDGSGKDDPAAAFESAQQQSLAEVLSDYAAAGANTDAIAASTDDLGHPFPIIPGDWFGAVDSWSLRWVLQHLVVQTARHTGQADIIRETLDGGTWIPLVAAAEGWPADGAITPWAQPETS